MAWPPPGSAVSARPSGHLCHAAREWSPRRGIPSCASPPCHTAITFVSEMCGNGGARPREGSPAKWAREARRPDGLERWLVSRTLLVSKHQLPFNLTFVLIQSVFIQNPSLERLQASSILILPIVELKQILRHYQLINDNVAFVICRLQLVCQMGADGFEFS